MESEASSFWFIKNHCILLHRRTLFNEVLCVQVFVNDQFLNWDPEHRIKVRIVSARAYHSLFMHNMWASAKLTKQPTFMSWHILSFTCIARAFFERAVLLAGASAPLLKSWRALALRTSQSTTRGCFHATGIHITWLPRLA